MTSALHRALTLKVDPVEIKSLNGKMVQELYTTQKTCEMTRAIDRGWLNYFMLKKL